MLRLDCLRSVYPDLENCLVVTIMGAVAAELQSLGHRANFFYLQHAMGLASSTGLGLALCLPDQTVIVFDGDGSLLMNLGSLATIGLTQPPNLTLVVMDNESYATTGGQATPTAHGADLAAAARAMRIADAVTVTTDEELRRALGGSTRPARRPTFVLAKVAESKPTAKPPLDAVAIKERFMRAIGSGA